MGTQCGDGELGPASRMAGAARTVGNQDHAPTGLGIMRDEKIIIPKAANMFMRAPATAGGNDSLQRGG